MGVPCRCHTGKAAHFCGDPPAGTDGVCWWNARDGRPNLPARKTNMGTAPHVETAHSRDKSLFQVVVVMYPTAYKRRRLTSLRRGVNYSACSA